jgi:crotonobetainyl-CoA:carnitine CoA-transferase CaiB-like acyl-CoA transferase
MYLGRGGAAYGCTGCAKIARHPKEGYVCSAHSPVDLPPGMVCVVALLRALGYKTTDSGNGKGQMEGALPFPHVVAVVSPVDLVSEANRLKLILEELGIAVHPQGPEWCTAPAIEGAYDVGAGVATIMLTNVTDATLREAPDAS